MTQCTECSREVKCVVAIDIDGTLGDYHSQFLRFASAYLGEDIPTSYHGTESFKVWFCEQTGVDHRTWNDVKLAYRQGAQKRSMPVYEGAVALCRDVREFGGELWLTTTRPHQRLDNVDPDTQWWLKRAGIKYDYMLYDDDKYKLLAEWVDPKRVVAVLDDLPEQYRAAAVEFGPEVPMLRSTQYNQGCGIKGYNSLPAVGVQIAARINEWKVTGVLPTPRVVKAKAEEPCVVCGRPIESGRLYVVDGPSHIKCQE